MRDNSKDPSTDEDRAVEIRHFSPRTVGQSPLTLHDKIEMRKDDKIDDSGGLEYKETPSVRWSTSVV
ncbi:hypothetical protein N7451_000063 [Penicillium sp. IBT 35674x]|nr:hypothetical protein N7451_000063 [Penicillium sp. IBT 35674x]